MSYIIVIAIGLSVLAAMFGGCLLAIAIAQRGRRL